jgi:hypothetical protein
MIEMAQARTSPKTAQKAAPKEEVQTLGSDQTARLLDISGAFLRRLTQDGKIPKQAKGRYVLDEAVRAYIRFLRDENARTTKSAHQNRMHEAKAAEIEMRLAERRRELIPTEDVYAAIDIMIAKFRDELAGLPARFTRDMDLRRKLEAETHESQNRIAEALAATAKFIREGGELSAGGEGDDA